MSIESYRVQIDSKISFAQVMTLLTIQQVAELAGVSSATVSRVLNNAAHVKKDTREKVLKVIESVNYQPNSAGRSLRLNKSHVVMVVLPDITNTFFSKIVRSIEQTANRHGYDVFVFEMMDDLKSEEKIQEFLTMRKVDGLIHLSARTHLQRFVSTRQGIPTVLACEYIEHMDMPSVSIDNIAAAMDATTYLISLGHSEIMYLNGPSDVILCRDRLRGYRIALEQLNLSYRDDHVLEGDFTMESGYKLARGALQSGSKFTALFCANDAMAIGAMRAIQERGLRIPEDVSVVGFDDIDFAAFSHPTLTTITQPVDEIGSRAMEMWVRLAEGAPVKYPMKLPHNLTIRKSCAPPKRS